MQKDPGCDPVNMSIEYRPILSIVIVPGLGLNQELSNVLCKIVSSPYVNCLLIS